MEPDGIEERIRDIQNLFKASQDALVEFVRNDLAIAIHSLNRSKDRRNPIDVQIALSNARVVLHTARFLNSRVQDRDAWSELHRKADLLEAAIAELPHIS